MYAVVFKSVLNDLQDASYDKMATHIDELVKNQDGFIDAESFRNADKSGCTISYWESMTAIEKWKDNKQHIQAKTLGKQKWYKSYTLDIIHIRQYQESDAAAIANIYYNTIHKINNRDYSAEQINAWAPYASVENYSGWQAKLAKVKPFVAVINDTIVGFAEFEANGHIDCFYVHHEYQSKGIGSALMKAIFDKAEKQNIGRIYAEVSITAKPFFEEKGFNIVKEQTVTLRSVELNNFVMEKCLNKLESNLCTSDIEWQAAKTYRQKYFFDKVPIDDPYTWTFTHKDHKHFVLYNNTEIIGYSHIVLWPENRAAMRIIVIDEGNRKKGFGKRFMEKIEEWGKNCGLHSLHLESNPYALHFYTKLGYAPMPFNDPEGYEGGPPDIAVGKRL